MSSRALGFCFHDPSLPSDLVAVALLDETHTLRRVRCVTWTPGHAAGKPRRAIAGSAGGGDRGESGSRGENWSRGSGEKFALKVIMRGKGDVHCRDFLSEKAVMLALSGSDWHAQLVNT